MKKQIILFVLTLISLTSIAQYSSYKLNYYGSAEAEIDGLSDIVDVQIPTGTTLTVFDVNVYHPNSYYSSGQNTQDVNYISIYSSSTNFSSNDYYDIYGNSYTQLSLDANETSDFIIQQSYTGDTEADLMSGFTSTATFPITSYPEYRQATTRIQSNHPDIVNLGNSLSTTSVQGTVENIAKWVIGNLEYSSSYNNNQDMDALSVFYARSGNCAGYTNLAIALLRSQDIPVRYVSGVILYYPFTMPSQGTTFTWGDRGSGPHAMYEVYYPDRGWVISDPQSTLNFATTHFIRHNHGPDNCDRLSTFEGSYTGANPPTIIVDDMCGTITSFDNEYDYDSFSMYQTYYQDKSIISVAPDLSTGIYDEVEIVSAPNNFKTGETISCQANFTSADGTTYVETWNWKILLYHTGGTYQLCSESYNFNIWYPTTNPILPSYNWLIDPLGNIYGEIIVTVDISDGDFKTARLPVSVEECNELYLLNKTYTSNTTKQGCYITVENVNVQNGAKLTLDSEMGITIDSDFNVVLGAEFETQ